MSDSNPLILRLPPARSPLRTSLISYLILFCVRVLLAILLSRCLTLLTHTAHLAFLQ